MNGRNAATCKTTSGLRFPPTNLVRVAQQFHFHALIVLPFASGTRKSGGTVRAGRAFGRMQQTRALGYARHQTRARGARRNHSLYSLDCGRRRPLERGYLPQGPTTRSGRGSCAAPPARRTACVRARFAHAVHTAPRAFAAVYCWESNPGEIVAHRKFFSIRARALHRPRAGFGGLSPNQPDDCAQVVFTSNKLLFALDQWETEYLRNLIKRKSRRSSRCSGT